MTPKRMSLLLATLGVATLAGCAHQWETVLDGRLYTRTHLHRYPVSIVAVDGDYSSLTPRRVDAGEHLLTVDAPPATGRYLADRKEFTFKAQKCVRYWLAAQRPSAYSRDFDLVVDHAEPVPGCQPTSGAPLQAVIVPADPAQIEAPKAVLPTRRS